MGKKTIVYLNPDERPEYKLDCDCRKPRAGLLLQAAQDFNIDLSQSYMIGDSDGDVATGIVAGCKQVVKITTNKTNALTIAIDELFSTNG